MQRELCSLSFRMYVCVCVSSWEGLKRSVCENVDVSRQSVTQKFDTEQDEVSEAYPSTTHITRLT